MSLTPLLRALLLVGAIVSSPVSGQVTLSFLGGTSSAASGSGQSFTPGDAGTFATSSAFLTQMTFQTGVPPSFNGAPVFLDIYSNSALTAFVGASTNTQSWELNVSNATKTWTFDNLALDKTATYYAVFSSDAISGSTVTRAIIYGDNVYSGGALIYNTSLTPSLEANFTATFNTSAIPEPSTYAALAGLVALGLAVRCRRR